MIGRSCADRYQGLKAVRLRRHDACEEAGAASFMCHRWTSAATEHEIGRSGLQWSVESSVAGLSRVQPNFATAGLTQRLDVHPEIAYPMSFGGWRLRPSVGVRETATAEAGRRRIRRGRRSSVRSALNRADFEAGVETAALR